MTETLNISYAEWKATTLAAGYDTYHQDLPDESEPAVRVFSGTPEVVLRALARDNLDAAETDHADWVTSFQTGSTLVDHSEDATYRIKKAAALAPSALGQMVVSVAAAAEPVSKGTKYDFWAEDQTFDSNSFTTVYDSATANSVRIHGCTFRLNDDKVIFRAEVGIAECIEVDLKDYDGAFKSQKMGELSGLGLVQFESKRWSFTPPYALQSTSVRFMFKRRSGNGDKKVEWGFTVREIDLS